MRQWLEKPFYCHTFPNPTLFTIEFIGSERSIYTINNSEITLAGNNTSRHQKLIVRYR
jgi:hypothetical protein